MKSGDESNPSRRICNLPAVSLHRVADNDAKNNDVIFFVEFRNIFLRKFIGAKKFSFFAGDFAIYMNNGLSKCKALLMNFAAACFNFVGLYIALALSEDSGVRDWLLSFVGGMFLYLSLVNVVSKLFCQCISSLLAKALPSQMPKMFFSLWNTTKSVFRYITERFDK